ncbi:GntR family transcriptional regulator [Brevibacterium sp. HMSC24B04]|uniref:GntR family transcriptional regulator n=1 Tax=Brevibacterium sp. HMSC24B04 TaxID=1581060 RepID=UPI0008A32849|nr:GntR family transcriptional regulator [Brevibacterium sp. HMSC24B04]OFT92203.1 hypothetical protein HMPREF3092_08070 [Brevibacterium sp. HMSC24B04]
MAGVERGQAAQRARMGRPEKQSRANRAVARALALAGRDVVGQPYGTRGLAEELGVSQTLVSRACRWLEGDAAGGEAGPRASQLPAWVLIDEIRVEDSRLTLIFRAGEGATPDAREVGFPKASPGAMDSASSVDAAGASGVALRPQWGSTSKRRRGWAFLGALRQWADRDVFSIHNVTPDSPVRVREFHDFDAFAGAVAGLLTHVGSGVGLAGSPGRESVPAADGVPFDVLEFLADAVSADVNTFFWRRPVEALQIPSTFDSLSGVADSLDAANTADSSSNSASVDGANSSGGQHPDIQKLDNNQADTRRPFLHPWREVGDTVWRRTFVAELEADIRERDLHAGDQVSVRHLAARMGVAQREIVRGLSELQTSGVLERAGNVFRLPVVSGESVLDLYAARYAVGVVVLRGASAGRVSRQAAAGQLTPSRRTSSELSESRAAPRAEQARGSLHIADRALSRLEADDSLGPRSVDRLDLQFQQGLAEASGLEHTADVFDSLGQRLRLLIAILRVDYAPAAAKIRSDNAAILAAVRKGRADEAIAVWRSKIENAVRHMSSVAGLRRFDVAAWLSLVE